MALTTSRRSWRPTVTPGRSSAKRKSRSSRTTQTWRRWSKSVSVNNGKAFNTERKNVWNNIDCELPSSKSGACDGNRYNTLSTDSGTKPCKQECNCTLNEEFIVLLQKEIKRLQNITNDLSYQLIMNGHTPVIKESERMPIDLSINPLRRREQKSKISDQKMIPSKLISRGTTADCFETCTGYPVQPESTRPGSSFRIRNQNSSANTNCTGDMEAENSKTNIHKYFDKVADCQADCLASPNSKGDQEVWKYVRNF